MTDAPDITMRERTATIVAVMKILGSHPCARSTVIELPGLAPIFVSVEAGRQWMSDRGETLH
jgi:hypothetical protein